MDAPGLAALNFARQGLDRRLSDPVDLLRALIGVYSTAKTCHLALIARVDGYRPLDLVRLESERAVVHLTAMRSSGYVVAAEDAGVVAAATAASVRRSAWGIVKAFVDGSTYDDLAEDIEATLAGRALTALDIRKEIAPRTGDADVLKYVVRMMAAERRIVKIATAGTWRSDRARYARWSDWLPGVDPGATGEADARATLARRYFATYGPATAEDFAWWAGMSRRSEVAAAIAAAGLTPNGRGRMGGSEPAARPKGVRLLPVWDNVLMSHRDRRRVVSPAHHDHVYDHGGNGTSVVLVSGRAAGVWDMVEARGETVVNVAPFVPFTAAVWDEVDVEAQRLATALAAGPARVVRRTDPPTLRGAPQNLFRSPLRARA